MANQKPEYLAYTIVETNGDTDDNWQRVGSAWTNKDGSINISLNALPLKRQIAHSRPETR